MQYRRSNVKGGTYFFTVNLANRKSTLLIYDAKVLGNVMRQVNKRHPFHLDAIVVLPQQIHLISLEKIMLIFLHCAKSLSCPLITLDKCMKQVATELNIEILE